MPETIMILGVGNVLYSDDGVGIRVADKLLNSYDFDENVTVVDGGVLGINLLGVISQAKHLIVLDTVLNHGKPGDLHRLAGDEIPERILAKNSLHQVDLLEALTLCQAIGGPPETVIVGVEPEDLETLSPKLTKTVEARIDDLVNMALKELSRLGASYTKRKEELKSANPLFMDA